METSQTTDKTEETARYEVQAGRKAYYAKTAFLLLLVILLAFNIQFSLGFSISFVAYASMMLIFFSMNWATSIFTIAAVLALVTYFIPTKLRWKSTGQ